MKLYTEKKQEDTLSDIGEKIEKGERLTRQDGLRLLECDDLVSLGRLADKVKKEKSGDYVFFNVNHHINLTNVCLSRCKFCAFSCDLDDPKAYTLSRDDVLRSAEAASKRGITEFHIVSALHPTLPFDYYVDIIRALKREFPDIHIQAFTAVEIQHFSNITGLSVKEVLSILKDSGLGSLPGGGAEVFSKRIRDMLCPKKASTDEWLNVMRTAHSLGLKSHATILFGHIETKEETIEHLLKLRALQDETGGFQSFIPLAFHPKNTFLEHLRKPTAFESLRMIAVSRLVLDNFLHIKSFWIMLGLDVSQISLHFGADDLDGTIGEEKITHAAGAETDVGIAKERLIGLIKEAGRTPVERDTLYNILRIY